VGPQGELGGGVHGVPGHRLDEVRARPQARRALDGEPVGVRRDEHERDAEPRAQLPGERDPVATSPDADVEHGEVRGPRGGERQRLVGAGRGADHLVVQRLQQHLEVARDDDLVLHEQHARHD
jgi:hypothetical protein